MVLVDVSHPFCVRAIFMLQSNLFLVVSVNVANFAVLCLLHSITVLMPLVLLHETAESTYRISHVDAKIRVMFSIGKNHVY